MKRKGDVMDGWIVLRTSVLYYSEGFILSVKIDHDARIDCPRRCFVVSLLCDILVVRVQVKGEYL